MLLVMITAITPNLVTLKNLLPLQDPGIKLAMMVLTLAIVSFKLAVWNSKKYKSDNL